MRRTDKKLLLNDRTLIRFLETIAAIMIIVGLSGCALRSGESSKLREAVTVAEEETSSVVQEEEASPQSESIYVYACGEVSAPGVYELPAGSRVFEVIEAAGGLTEEASKTYLNQAEKLSDGQQIYVPSIEEASEKLKSGGRQQEQDDGRVNLNTASKEELLTLSGIGEVKAEAIIRYREDKGGFSSIEELKEIEGIKDGIFNKVKDQIKI